MATKEPKRVVVVGSGLAARALAKYLQPGRKDGSIHLTIIQANNFQSLPILETLVLTQKLTFEANTTYEEVRDVDETVFGVAKGCAKDGVLVVEPLADPSAITKVPFDILVAASGFAFPVINVAPGQSVEDRKEELNVYSTALLSGKNVVIAGGGVTGVELAGDILDALPANAKKGTVTLVCSSSRILPDQPEYYSQRCAKVLLDRGCTILYNDKVASHVDSCVALGTEPLTLTLQSGKTLDCHSYVASFARGPNTSWLKPSKHGQLPSSVLNDAGQVAVNEFLQSTSYGKLYAVMATNDVKEACIIPNIEPQAKVVADHIRNPSTAKPHKLGVQRAFYQVVGHDTFATVMTENLPMPPAVATLCCQWCGFPCNLLCPCFACCVLFGPMDAMVCGYCCDRPEGMGLNKTMAAFNKSGMGAKKNGYYGVGQGPPEGKQMTRD